MKERKKGEKKERKERKEYITRTFDFKFGILLKSFFYTFANIICIFCRIDRIERKGKKDKF